MLHNPFSSNTPNPPHTRPSLQLPNIASISRTSSQIQVERFSDARTHGFRGPSRAVTLPHAASSGSAAISKNSSGDRCVVVGNGSIRILTISDGAEKPASEHKYSIGYGGFRIDASRNYWAANGTKVDSALTDVVWCAKALDSKIVTSSRNGELSLWDLNRSGTLKLERKTRAHMRSINKLSYSSSMPNYCCSGSSDGNLRLWDLRDPTTATHTIHHLVEIRTVLFSPTASEPFSAVTGLENGSLCRWDLRAGQKGILERIPLAHTGAILSFDWCDQYESCGWLASAGLDRTVKVWNLGGSHTNSSTTRPSYVLHVSNPVRRVIWRPGYETELAVAYYSESTFNPNLKTPQPGPLTLSPSPKHVAVLNETAQIVHNSASENGNGNGKPSLSSVVMPEQPILSGRPSAGSGEVVEIWDVRRPWLAKWTVSESDSGGGISDMSFADSHALWVQNNSGAFSQMDLRFCEKPIDLIPRSAVTWNPAGALTFVTDRPQRGTIPYDDRLLVPRTSERIESHKKLGDRRFAPSSQTLATMFEASDGEDWEAFVALARRYKIEGESKSNLCESNAHAAFEAGQIHSGQIWLLLRSLLLEIETYRPPSPPSLSHKASVPSLLHSSSAPAVVQGIKGSPGKPLAARSSSDDPPKSARATEDKGEGAETHSPTLVSEKVKRSQTVNISSLGRPRRLSLRRRSLSKAVRDHDRSTSSTARRKTQVGEGALGDSDSSEEAELLSPHLNLNSKETSSGEATAATDVLFNEVVTRVQSRLVSSPMVREDEWAEDERENSSDESPDSGPSSGSDSDSSNASTTAARSSSQHRSAMRSRTSTIAAMSGSAFLRPQLALKRTDSNSSMQTITAANGNGVGGNGKRLEPYSHQHQQQSSPLQREAAGNGRESIASPAPSRRSKKRLSQAFSFSGMQATTTSRDKYARENEHERDMRFLEWNHVSVQDSEKRYRQAAWDSLRASIYALAENGEVQLCATLCCVARSELGIPATRALMFLESYIDILSRLQLHSVLAYIRKYAPAPEIRNATQVMTTVYTSCSSCGKAIVDPSPGLSGTSGFSRCTKCKAITICTICHLPVRSTLMACMICSHGGHRECYLRYFLSRPMVTLPPLGQEPEKRGRRPLRAPDSFTDNEVSSSWGVDSNASSMQMGDAGGKKIVRMTGHSCASGCGHVCWAASERVSSL